MKTRHAVTRKREDGTGRKRVPFSRPLVFSFSLIGAALLFAAPSAHAQGLKAAAAVERSLCPTNAITMVSRSTTMFSVTAYNVSASDLYLHVFDATSTPAANTVPTLPAIKVTANTTAGYDFNIGGCKFANGIVVATSTTPVTFTNGTASFQIAVTHAP
jgi:hypothetical protein